MRITPIRALKRATVLAVFALALAACDGNSNSPIVVNPGPGTPPAVNNTFTTFVKSLLATTAADTAAPVDVNARELTFDESATAFNDTLGN